MAAPQLATASATVKPVDAVTIDNAHVAYAKPFSKARERSSSDRSESPSAVAERRERQQGGDDQRAPWSLELLHPSSPPSLPGADGDVEPGGMVPR